MLDKFDMGDRLYQKLLAGQKSVGRYDNQRYIAWTIRFAFFPPPPFFFCLKWLSVIAIYQRSGGSWTSSCACEQICPQIISLTLFLARRGHHTFILPTIPYCPYLNDRYSAQSRLISLVMTENNIWVDDTAPCTIYSLHRQYTNLLYLLNCPEGDFGCIVLPVYSKAK